jgi:DNA polymerase gamma 1
MDTMPLHVAVNGIFSHQRPAWNKWKKKREAEKVQRVEAVEAMVDLITQAKEEGQ